MQIDISGPNGNIFAVLAIAKKLMGQSGRTLGEINKMTSDVFGSDSYQTACKIIAEATNGAIEFYDSSKE
jgi:hypothetical protein